jgi:hypothetical protein
MPDTKHQLAGDHLVGGAIIDLYLPGRRASQGDQKTEVRQGQSDRSQCQSQFGIVYLFRYARV